MLNRRRSPQRHVKEAKVSKPDRKRQKRPRRSPAPEERRRDPERTKERILDAAVEVFSRKGFAGARVAEIASQAGVNKQLITYYFNGKEGLYKAIGSRWRNHEEMAYPSDQTLVDELRTRVLDSADDRHGSKLLAWQGLTDGEFNDVDAEERNARVQEEVSRIKLRQSKGEISAEIDAASLLLILMGAANALSVYPHIARGAFGVSDTKDSAIVERYAEEVAKIFGKLS